MKKISVFIVMFSALLSAQAIQTPALEFAPNKYVCYKTENPLTIDGKMDEEVWSKTEWTQDFVDIEGAVKPAPRLKTRTKMLWDDNYFYVAAEITEPDIWAYVQHRDEVIFFDNDFEVFIDPDGDTHRYCEFEMNALNTVWDLLLIQPYRDTKNAPVDGWDIKGLKTAVHLNGTINTPGDTDKSWTVEIAFPWAAFKQISLTNTPPDDKSHWRVNFSRVEWKTETVGGKYKKQINPATGKPYPEDNWVWSPQGVVNMHYPEMWGFVQFAKETAGTKKVDFADNPIEAVKWQLRMIYYKESQYFEKNGKYSNNLGELGLTLKSIPGFEANPLIECTSGFFEASIKSLDGTNKVHIRTDGLTWITNSGK